MSRHKSLSRLRTLLESVTLAAVATAGTASVAAAAAPAPTLVPPPGPVDDDELAHRLAAYLTDLPPLDAAGTSAELATSVDVDERVALAEALAWVFPLASDDVLIDHLADDPAPRVRAAVARAAWSRNAVRGDTGVVRRLLGDADAGVRAAAWRAVKR